MSRRIRVREVWRGILQNYYIAPPKPVRLEHLYVERPQMREALMAMLGASELSFTDDMFLVRNPTKRWLGPGDTLTVTFEEAGVVDTFGYRTSFQEQRNDGGHNTGYTMRLTGRRYLRNLQE